MVKCKQEYSLCFFSPFLPSTRIWIPLEPFYNISFSFFSFPFFLFFSSDNPADLGYGKF